MFLNKIKNVKFTLEVPSSFTNPTFLKEPLTFNDIINEINQKFDL